MCPIRFDKFEDAAAVAGNVATVYGELILAEEDTNKVGKPCGSQKVS